MGWRRARRGGTSCCPQSFRRRLGTAYVYSDVGMITMGRVCEIASGTSLDALVRSDRDGAAGAAPTRATGLSAALLPRIAATEFKLDRAAWWAPRRLSSSGAAGDPRAGPRRRQESGAFALSAEAECGRARGDRRRSPGLGAIVRGEVHDETAHALGGVAGHAGLFSTVGDLLRFAEILRTGGAGVLSAESVAEMMRDQGVHGGGVPAGGSGSGSGIRRSWGRWVTPMVIPGSPGPLWSWTRPVG